MIIDLSVSSKTAVYSGDGTISGTLPDYIVTVNGQPSVRKIMVLVEPTMKVVAQTWSNIDGSFLISNISAQYTYSVVCFDHNKQFNTLILSGVRPVSPPHLIGDGGIGFADGEVSDIRVMRDGHGYSQWRVFAHRGSDPNYIYITEILFEGHSPTGGTIIYSSQWDTGIWSAASAFDGDLGTAWCTTRYSVTNQYVGYDFGEKMDFSDITIDCSYRNDPPPLEMSIQGSDDGVNWDTIYYENDIDWGPSRIKTIVLS